MSQFALEAKKMWYQRSLIISLPEYQIELTSRIVSTVYCTYIHVHVHVYNIIYIRAGKKVRIFEPSFVCYTLEAKFLPSKLCCHAHFNVCTCAI